ncbi:MAG: hypothetical protein PHE83_14280 [Opitutaceae bacterium]|nr:hypothetical protein [Opitutaceae bacterium]
MAWRIDEFVARGEIDNRVRGRVTGRLWFAGRAEPVELDLAGNAWRDLAGRRLVFTNPRPKAGLSAGLVARQDGVVGDLTASRKVKVPEIPLAQIGEYDAACKPWPWHWGNALYLEWFSGTNGRVVIESVDYELTMAGDAAWDMTPAAEEEQRRANGEALGQFMERLEDVASGAEKTEDPAKTVGDDDHPQTEEEAERMQEESDRLMDRIMARMEREGPDADYERILEEELERRRRERGEPPPTPEQEAARAAWIEELNRAAEEAAADPWSPEKAEHKHPLAEQAFEFSVRLHQEVDRRSWLPAGASQEHPVAELVAMAMRASAKLAGALNGRDGLPPVGECGGCIARLKRARGCFSDALLAADACAGQKLVADAWLAAVQRELAELGEATDRIIAELRARLERGWD